MTAPAPEQLAPRFAGAGIGGPAIAVGTGALLLSLSAPLVKVADAGPATAALWRCALAVPLLWLVVANGSAIPMSLRHVAASIGAGLCFATDLLLWHAGIAHIGAGLATVLGNLQVGGVAVLAWLIHRERPTRSLVLAAPALLGGVLLVAGVGAPAAYGTDPARGALLCVGSAAAYSGFLLLLRDAAASRGAHRPLLAATSTAALALVPAAAWLDGGILPPLRALPWLALLAISSQVVAWLLISSALPRLPAGEGAALLLLQPVGALAVSGIALGESPTSAQVTGAAVVVVAVAWATSRSSGPA